MNILYVGYWPAADTLTQAVILPRLQLLSEQQEVEKIVFCSIERGSMTNLNKDVPKTKWIAFQSKNKGNVLLTKFSDFTELPPFLIEIIQVEKIDLVIANSPLAGGACYLALRKIKIKLIVECFEPHAESMLESGVWRRWDLRYWILRYLETNLKKHAWRLITVSHHYTKKLASEGVSDCKIITMPNCLRIENFRFQQDKRNEMRNSLAISDNQIVGVYVGKFGGIYYDKEAYKLFASAFHFFGERFRLIILTGHTVSEVSNNLKKQNVDLTRVFISSVPHSQVANYLSASDFAFATIKPTPTRLYCCPVKNGEYWANGLPVLLEGGIGDDSDILKKEGGGVILNHQMPNASFNELQHRMGEGRSFLANKIHAIAEKHRSDKLMKEVYEKVFQDYSEKAFT